MEAKFPKKLRELFEPRRYKFIKGGRGSGKSWGVARALLILGAKSRERVLCTREVQKSIQQSVHQLLRDQIEELGLTSFYEVLKTEIRGKNGTQFFFAGLSDLTADSIKSFEGCTRFWLEEGHTITARSWNILTPTVRANDSEIWVTYNPELDTDETHRRAVIEPFPGTLVIEMNWSDNPWFPQVLEDERQHALKTMRPEDYSHVWEGRCKPAVEGAIYFDQIVEAEASKRVRNVPRDPSMPVHRVWDLGFNDAMSIILVQRVVSELAIVGYVEDNGRTLSEYIADFNGPEYAGWNWGADFLPHDGFAVRHQSGKSDAAVLRSLGCRVPTGELDGSPVPDLSVEQGIRHARLVFPRIYFDRERAKRLVECLKRYRRQIGVKTQEPGAPLHDKYSHGADAFRYLCLVADQLRNEAAKPLPKIKRKFVV